MKHPAIHRLGRLVGWLFLPFAPGLRRAARIEAEEERRDPLDGATETELRTMLEELEPWHRLAAVNEHHRGQARFAQVLGPPGAKDREEARHGLARHEVEVVEGVIAHVRHHVEGGGAHFVVDPRVRHELRRYLELARPSGDLIQSTRVVCFGSMPC